MVTNRTKVKGKRRSSKSLKRKRGDKPATVTLKRRRLISRIPQGPAIPNQRLVKMRNVSYKDAHTGDYGGSSYKINLWDPRYGGGMFGSEPFGWSQMEARFHDYMVQSVKVKVLWKPTVGFTTGVTPTAQSQILLARFDGGNQEPRTNSFVETYGNPKNKILHSKPFYWDVQLAQLIPPSTEGMAGWSVKGENKYFKAYRKPIFDLNKDVVDRVKEDPTPTSASPTYVDEREWAMHLEFLPERLIVTDMIHYEAYIVVDFYVLFMNPKLQA